jgi:hypothetical protein
MLKKLLKTFGVRTLQLILAAASITKFYNIDSSVLQHGVQKVETFSISFKLSDRYFKVWYLISLSVLTNL